MGCYRNTPWLNEQRRASLVQTISGQIDALTSACPVCASCPLGSQQALAGGNVEIAWSQAFARADVAMECHPQCPAVDLLVSLLGALRPAYSEALSA